jgi:hypothetical protein
MKKRKMEQKTIFTGNGQSTLITIAPNGNGQFNLLIEDDTDVLSSASNLHSRKDCEIAAALYFLIRNGHSADIYIHGTKRKPVLKTKETKIQFNLTEPEEPADALTEHIRSIVQQSLTNGHKVR